MTNPTEKFISKIKCIRKRRGLGFLLSVSALLLALAVGSISWFTAQISLNGSSIKTGSIRFAATGYDSDATLVTTILPEGETGDETWLQPLFKTDNLAVGDAHTAYLVLENKGSLATDYAISFSASGQVEYLGGYWYAMTDISALVPAEGSDQEKLNIYKTTYPTGVKEEDSDANNMVTMERYSMKTSFDKGNLGKRYFRLDYGMKKSAITTDYTGKTIQIATKIHAAQAGHLTETPGGHIYTVFTVQELDKAIIEALPGDTIQLGQSISYNGDIVFNRAINMVTGKYTLTVNGNLIYSYVAANDLVITTAGGGSIRVLSPQAGVGGNFTINAPNSNVQFNGAGAATSDIIVAQKLTVNATRAYGAGGLTLAGCRITSATTGSLAVVYLDSDTRVTVTGGTTIGILCANAKATNIEIDNSGTINQIVLTDMYLLAQTGSPQIYILNAGIITKTIELPSWSVKFVGSGLEATGNTKIVKTYTGSNMTVSGSDSFSDEDIMIETSDVIVEQIIPGSDDALRVYYQDLKEGASVTKTTLQSLLTDYFTSQGASPGTGISNIAELEIVSVEEKALDSTDFAYIKSNSMRGLRILNMERARVYDTANKIANCLPNKALDWATKLTKVVLPNTLVSMQPYALAGLSGLQSVLVVPASVDTYYGTTNVFSNMPYLEFLNPTPAANLASAVHSSVKIIFAPESNLGAYQAIFGTDRVFPPAVMADDKKHFVRDLGGDRWEIVCYGGAGNQDSHMVIGEDIYLDGFKLNIVKVGNNAYRGRLTATGQTLTFADSITEIGVNSFMSCIGITAIDMPKVEIIRGAAFYTNSGLTTANMPEAVTIEGHAFYGCENLSSVDVSKVETLGAYAFLANRSLVRIDLPELTTLDSRGYTFQNCYKLVSVSMPQVSRLPAYLFSNCSSLREIYFGDRDTAMVSGDLVGTWNAGTPPKLKYFVPAGSYDNYAVLGAGKVYEKGEKAEELLVHGYDIGQYIIGDTSSDTGSGTAKIITYNLDVTGDYTIPEVLNKKTITSLGRNAYRSTTFTNCNLTMPGLKEIGANAFNGRTGILSVQMPEAVTIGGGAFNGSANLQAASMPKALTIGEYAFQNCENLSSVDVRKVETLGAYAFLANRSLVRIDLPELTTLDSRGYTFQNCYKLVSVSMPQVSRLPAYLFSNCSSLREIYFGDRDTAMVSGDLAGTWNAGTPPKLKYFVPAGSYDNYAVLGAGKVYEKGEKAESLLVHGYDIGQYIIGDTSSGTAKIITYNLDVTGDYTIPEVLKEKTITSLGRNAYRSTTFTNCNLTMPGLKEIGANAFNGRTGILSVQMPEAVTIGQSAFQDCANLSSVDVRKVETLESLAFKGNSSLVCIDLPELTTLGGYTFQNCYKLVSVSMPKVQYLSPYMFIDCSSLREIYFGDRNTAMTSSDLGFSWNTLTHAKLKYFVPAGSYDKYAVLGNRLYEQGEKAGVQEVHGYDIGQYIIGDTSSDIGSVTGKIITCNVDITGDYTVPREMKGKAITSLGRRAFKHTTFTNCNLNMPSLKEIGAYAFDGRLGILSVQMPEAVTIGNWAFLSSAHLTTASMPKAVTIGTSAFQDCANLSSVDVSKVKTLGNYAFYRDKSLISINLPELITLDAGGGMFSECSKLVSVSIPKVQRLPVSTFYACGSLREIYFGDRDTVMTGSELGGSWNAQTHAKLKCFVPAGSYDKYAVLGDRLYEQGEKAGQLLVHDYNIGEYIIGDTSSDTGSPTGKIITCNLNITGDYTVREEMNLRMITSLGKNAFRSTTFTNCNLNMPGLKEIRDSAFAHKTGLLSVAMPEVTTIGDSAFEGCTALISVNLPKLNIAGNGVFNGCTGLVSVTITGLQRIPEKMFYGCSSLREINFGPRNWAMTNNDIGAANWNEGIHVKCKYFVPVTSYNQYAILNSEGRLYEAGTKVGAEWFRGYDIGEYIVAEDTSATSKIITCNKDNITGNHTVPGELNGKPVTSLKENVYKDTTFTSCNLTLPNVQEISFNTFHGNTGIRSMDMPKVTSIGSTAFAECKNLVSVSLPQVTSVASSLFQGCVALETAYFENVTYFDEWSFDGCSSLKSITINKVITNGGEIPTYSRYAFPDLPGGNFTLYVPAASLSYYGGVWAGRPVASIEGTSRAFYGMSFTDGSRTYVVSDVEGGYELLYFRDTQVCQELVLPSVLGEVNLVGIAQGAFAEVSNSLEDLTLSQSIRSLKSGTLSECMALQNIYVEIGNEYYLDKEGVLYNTDGKMLVLYPCARAAVDYRVDDDTIAIAGGAFSNVAQLQSITFGANLGVIDSQAFEGCNSIKTITFTGDRPPILSGTGIFDTRVEGFEMIIAVENALSVMAEDLWEEEGSYSFSEATPSDATPSDATPGNADRINREPVDMVALGASDVLASYLCAYNFEEYVPFMKASNQMELPDVSGQPKNQLPWPSASDVPLTRQPMLLPEGPGTMKKKEEPDELPETLPTEGGDGADPDLEEF